MLTKYLYYTKMNLFYDKYKTTFSYYINNYFNVLFKFDLNRIQRNKIFYDTYKEHINYNNFKISVDVVELIKTDYVYKDYLIYLFFVEHLETHNLKKKYEEYLIIEFEKISKTLLYNKLCINLFSKKIREKEKEIENLNTRNQVVEYYSIKNLINKLEEDKNQYVLNLTQLETQEYNDLKNIQEIITKYKKMKEKIKNDSFFMRRIENLQSKTLITKNNNIEKEIFENKQQQNFIMGYKEKYSKVLKKSKTRRKNERLQKREQETTKKAERIVNKNKGKEKKKIRKIWKTQI